MATDDRDTTDERRTEPGEGRPHGGEQGDAREAATSGGHHPAKAHGRPAVVDESLPATRAELLALHAVTRRRRAAAPLGSEEYRAAADLIGRIEVRIAALERAQVPPAV